MTELGFFSRPSPSEFGDSEWSGVKLGRAKPKRGEGEADNCQPYDMATLTCRRGSSRFLDDVSGNRRTAWARSIRGSDVRQSHLP
ncbi:hypothetical protein H6P81_019799 [Aristolochia fimbriata]|uniref:Uncharacterized protein n=1 Tax=Aristolochia fimbriata TaxID=158543 RepID=A0AAV7DTL9_ARIFI|nr:hypothetical protein H6P81_019799 [Aristolochia fimbriata]